MSAENDAEWWEGALEEDTTWYLPLEGEGGLWAGGFPPPPPRPDFLDEDISPDGLTTCDLCTWARAAADPNSDSSSGMSKLNVLSFSKIKLHFIRKNLHYVMML